MKFLSRGLLGAILTATTIGLLFAAMIIFAQSMGDEDDARGGPRGGARERVFNVEVIDLTLGTAQPIVAGFGEVISGKTLELRAASEGEIVYLDENFREGGEVVAGTLLFRTDPADARTRLQVERTLLSEAKAEGIEARAAVTLAREELAAAKRQVVLRLEALDRQKQLRARRVGTDAALESAELSASSAEQSVLTKRQALANAEARVARAETALERAEINVETAERDLAATEVFAAFDGVLINVTAVEGGLVNAKERLGQLIDPSALEISIRLSNAQFASLLTEEGALRTGKVEITQQGLARPIPAEIVRVGAAVGEGQAGRVVFATLTNGGADTLRVGDFVAVQIEERPLEGVATVPVTAATSSGDVLVIGAEERLEAGKVTILRQQGDQLIVSPGALTGRAIVAKRAPQLGEGIKVKPQRAGEPVEVQSNVVKLTPEQQVQIREAVTANAYIPADVKERILSSVEKGEMARPQFERMAARMGLEEAKPESAAAPAAPDTVKLTASQQEKLLAFLESNDRMPKERKEQMIQDVKKGEVSKRFFDRMSERVDLSEDSAQVLTGAEN